MEAISTFFGIRLMPWPIATNIKVMGKPSYLLKRFFNNNSINRGLMISGWKHKGQQNFHLDNSANPIVNEI